MLTGTMEEATAAENTLLTYTCCLTGQGDTLKPLLLPVNEIIGDNTSKYFNVCRVYSLM